MFINNLILFLNAFIMLSTSPIENHLTLTTNEKINFEPALNFELAEQAFSATLIADFNGDGSDDLIIAHNIAKKLRIYYGQSSQDLLFDKSVEIGMSGKYSIGKVSALAKADFDENGLLDIVIASQQCNNDNTMFMIARNLGNDHFSTGACLKITSDKAYHDSFVYSIAVSDFNEDMHEDIVISRTGNYGSKQILIYYGNGDMTFSTVQLIYDAKESKKRPYEIIAMDIDDDGHQDILIKQAEPTKPLKTVLYLGDGAGHFTVNKDQTIHLPLNYPDINLDNIPDKIVSSNSETLIYLGTDSGTFNSKPQFFSFPSSSSNKQLSNIIADFNGDTKPDILVLDRNRSDNVLAKVYLQSSNTTNGNVESNNIINATIELKGKITAIVKNSIYVNNIAINYSVKTLINFEDGTGDTFAIGQIVEVQAYKNSKAIIMAIEIGVSPE